MVAYSAAAPTALGEPTFCPPRQRIYVLVTAILASSMAFIDGSVLSIAIPALRADLHATLVDAQWVSSGYLLLLGSLLLLGCAGCLAQASPCSWPHPWSAPWRPMSGC
ncbi:MAG: hypothetical protein ACOH2L_15240 [Devosia sp.]